MTPDEILNATKRDASRDSLFLSATLVIEGISRPVTVRVRNLSNGGMMVDGHSAFADGQTIEAELRGIGLVTGSVAWTESGRAGIAFDHEVDPKKARYIMRPVERVDLVQAPRSYGRRPGLRSKS